MDITQKFKTIAPLAMFDIHAAMNGTRADAAAVLGNFGRESGGFEFYSQLGMNADDPACGLSWGQWSGSRHTDFLHFCVANDLQPEGDIAPIKYLIRDLIGRYNFVWKDMLKVKSLYAKTATFEKYYEAAGVAALTERYQWALAALALPAATHGLIYPA